MTHLLGWPLQMQLTSSHDSWPSHTPKLHVRTSFLTHWQTTIRFVYCILETKFTFLHRHCIHRAMYRTLLLWHTTTCICFMHVYFKLTFTINIEDINMYRTACLLIYIYIYIYHYFAYFKNKWHCYLCNNLY